LSEWAGIKISFGAVGSVTRDLGDGDFEGCGEKDDVEVNLVTEGGQAFSNEVYNFASNFKLDEGINGDVDVGLVDEERIVNWAFWAFGVDGILLHCASGEGACNDEEGDEKNLHGE